jgi:hypothetical protein
MFACVQSQRCLSHTPRFMLRNIAYATLAALVTFVLLIALRFFAATAASRRGRTRGRKPRGLFPQAARCMR